LLLSTFWVGPPDKLAEVLIFTCKLKSHSWVNESILSVLGLFPSMFASLYYGVAFWVILYLADRPAQAQRGVGKLD